MKAKIRLKNYQFNTIKISGSKNSSLPIIAASILSDEPVIINNIPNISDVIILIAILKKMGYNIHFKNNTLIVNPTNIKQSFFNYKDIKKLRGSYYIMGALIGKYNYSNFSFLYPGGCKLGNRPINYHLDAFKKMGLNVNVTKRNITIKGYKSSCIHTLETPSVGTTINILLSCSKTENTTIINNAAIEPEVIDLCNFLRSMGTIIKIENRTISITGKKYLKGCNYIVMEDRIEAGTFLILGALHNGIKITNINYESVKEITTLLSDIGYTITYEENSITLTKEKCIKPFYIELKPHPGIPTDIGPLLCVLASQIDGRSIIKETVYHERNSHVKQLRKMNINISNINNEFIICGKSTIVNSKVKSFDLRCSAALLLASSLNVHFSTIYDIEKLFRGYEDIKQKLNSLGIEFII